MPLDFSKAEPDYELLADSIFRQEGGKATRYPYGIKSIKPKDEADARRIAINTARNNYARWLEAGQPGPYINFLADRYVPRAADPTGNANWKKNVASIYAASIAPKPAATNAVPVLPAYPPVIR